MGLLRGVARTAVIAGTATAVSNNVSRRQAGRWAKQQDEQDAQTAAQQQTAQQQAPAPVSMDEKMTQLKSLAELKSQGILSDAEFEQQKAAILNS
jgi:hypothetical protein